MTSRRFAPVWLGATAAVAMAVRLLYPTPVGMADNNDGSRLMCVAGADASAPDAKEALWHFVLLRYQVRRDQGRCGGYPSTEALPFRLVAWLHRDVLGLAGAIDLREMIVVYCLLCGVVVGAAARLVAGLPAVARWGLPLGLWVVLADATFADYAGSPFTEIAALNGLLVFAVAGVAVVAGTAHHRLAFLVAWLGAVFAVGAKTHTLTLVLPLALFFGFRRLEVGRLAGRGRDRVLPILAVVSLLAVAAWEQTGGFADGHPQNQATNVGNEITMTIMPKSDDPGQAAVDLGLPRSFGHYSGTHAWSPHPIQADPGYPAVAGRFTEANLERYLVTHPALSLRIAVDSSAAYLKFRNEYLGTYPLGSGYHADAQECRVCVLTGASHLMQGTGIWGVLGYWGACLAGAVWLLRRSGPGTPRRGFGLVAVTLVAGTVVQYATAVYGEGNEVTKHLVVALFAASLTPLWLLAGWFAPGRRPEPRPDEEQDEQDKQDQQGERRDSELDHTVRSRLVNRAQAREHATTA